MPPLLAIENLRVRGAPPVDLTLEAGSCTGLTGASGAGKSLLLRAVADLDPHDGQVRLEGVAAESWPAPRWRRAVGLLPAESRWWHDTVGPHFEGLPEEWLTRLGFTPEVLRRPVRFLSSGERQRLALARLLGNQPRVLLLDEPTSNLDAANSRRFQAVVRDYLAHIDGAALWVSHDLDLLAQLGGRCFRLTAAGLTAFDPRAVAGETG